MKIKNERKINSYEINYKYLTNTFYFEITICNLQKGQKSITSIYL